ncbi:MAG TPA: TetR/AcrR family transcriptional regulator [Dongiaceae bacterium]|nr:TetR/AcrR family transcriptional regulator [Dongiaceae bacterium]
MTADATRDRIKKAALQLFVSKGVKETTTRDLARAARIAEGTIYRHYESKDELVRDLFEGYFTAFCDELDNVQSTAGAGVSAKLRAMIDYMCQLFDSDRTLYQFLLVVQHEALPTLVTREKSPTKILRRVISQAIKRGEIPEQDVQLSAAMVLGAVMQPAVALIYGSLQGRMNKFAPRIHEACRRILHAD